MSIVDRAIDNWDSRKLADKWKEAEIYVKDRSGNCITEGQDFQVAPKTYPIQIHTQTGDIFPYQGPLSGFVSSALYLTAAVPFKGVTFGGNLCHAVYYGASAVQKIWSNWGEVQFSNRQALAPVGKHLWHAIKDLCILYVANSVYKSSPAPLGFHLVHYIAFSAIIAGAAYNPLEARVWLNNRVAGWDIRPLQEAELRRMSVKEKAWSILDGSYSFLRLLGMERMGNKETDKATIELVESKKK